MCYTAPSIAVVKIVYSYSPMFFTITYHKMFNLHLGEFNSRRNPGGHQHEFPMARASADTCLFTWS